MSGLFMQPIALLLTPIVFALSLSKLAEFWEFFSFSSSGAKQLKLKEVFSRITVIAMQVILSYVSIVVSNRDDVQSTSKPCRSLTLTHSHCACVRGSA